MSADTLVKMAEDSFIASVNYRQIDRRGAFIGDPYFLGLLPLVWGTQAEFQVIIGSHLAVIPTWKIAWWWGWCTFQFSRCRGWRHSGRGWRMLKLVRRWLAYHAFISAIHASFVLPCSILPDLQPINQTWAMWKLRMGSDGIIRNFGIGPNIKW